MPLPILLSLPHSGLRVPDEVKPYVARRFAWGMRMERRSPPTGRSD
jgi:hypothetical protein